MEEDIINGHKQKYMVTHDGEFCLHLVTMNAVGHDGNLPEASELVYEIDGDDER